MKIYLWSHCERDTQNSTPKNLNKNIRDKKGNSIKIETSNVSAFKVTFNSEFSG